MEQSQNVLFADAPAGPPGLQYEPEFLSAAEERDLLAAIVTLPLRKADYRGYTAKRRIASYGAGYDFDANVLRPAPPVPPFLFAQRARVAARAGVPAERLTHALVTEYRPGTTLGWHRDVPDFELVVGISLGTACRMRFRAYPPTRGQRVYSLELAPRSLYVLAGEVRWRWQHSIAATPGLRYSITLRTLAANARSPEKAG
jgi:alkylated DNA repair dioxygenase AlkB